MARAYLLPAGDDADVRLVAVPASAVTEEGLAGAVHELAAELAADRLLRIRLDRGLDIAVVPGYASESPPLYSRD
ncbi:hypothetical protein ACIBJF_28675 [Streptomyces sp. NPDC050743]|uniref:hypothetical protein n=1 Tax=Streptomyces sp. NPDC050743 TaxID=3365634 RepID=UPI0037BA0D58